MIRTILSFFIVTFVCISFVRAQGPKIGYVNSAKILQEYPDAIEAQKKIDAKREEWGSALEGMSKDLQAKYDDFQKKQATLTEQAKRDQQQQLIELEKRGQDFQKDKFGSNGELANFTDSLLTPIKKKVMKAIESIAKSEHLQFVFDRNEQILVLLYGEAKSDYTNLVIDRLKRGEVK